jgi:hypothetical protein
MKKEKIFWLGLVFVLSIVMAACSGTTPTPQTEEPKSAEIVDIEENDTDGPQTGDVAPDFTLADSNGNMVHMADKLNDNRMVILVFYLEHT